MSKKQSGLGRDLYSLFDDNFVDSKKSSATKLKLSEIEPRRDQPRKTFDHEQLEALAESIGKYGVLQPIIVKENISYPGTYEIIAGERRWRAAKMAGLNEIPVVLLDGDDLKAAQVSLIENLQREDLNPIEEAQAYRDLMTKFDLTQDQVATQVGKSRPYIANLVRLLDLPESCLAYVRDGSLSAGSAKALLALKDEDLMLRVIKKAVQDELSVRDVEKLVKLYQNMAKNQDDLLPEDKVSKLSQKDAYMKELERKIRESLGRKVKIIRTSRKKALELSFDNDEDFETLIKSICGDTFFDFIQETISC